MTWSERVKRYHAAADLATPTGGAAGATGPGAGSPRLGASQPRNVCILRSPKLESKPVTTRRFFEQHSTPLDQRLAAGLAKIGLAMRRQERRSASKAGLSATQAQILVLLSAEGVTSQSGLAHALDVSLPTISDSVGALVAKRLVRKAPGNVRRRGTALTLTRTGHAAARRAAGWPGFLANSLESLSAAQQERLLTTLLLLLRSLEEAQQLPAQRMCLTCAAFRPNARPGVRPHHCAFADAPMRSAHLRVACDDHHRAPAAQRESQWQQFLASTA